MAGDDDDAPQRAAEAHGRPHRRRDPEPAQRLGQGAGHAVEGVVPGRAPGAPHPRSDRVAVEDQRRADRDRVGAVAPDAHRQRGAVAVEAQDVADARAERAPDLLGDEPEQPLGLHLGGHRRRHPAQRGLLLGQSLHGQLGAPALGHVAHVAAEERRSGQVRARDGQLDGEGAAVGAHGGELDRVADDPPGAGVHVALQAAAMVLAQGTGRDHDLRELAADHLLGAVAEGRLGGRVDLDDVPAAVHRDDAVEGGVEDRRLARLALVHAALGAAALGKLPDLRPQAAHRGQQLVRRERGARRRRTP